jgi:hypothetical protein
LFPRVLTFEQVKPYSALMKMFINSNELKSVESSSLDQIICVGKGNTTGILMNSTNFEKVFI